MSSINDRILNLKQTSDTFFGKINERIESLKWYTKDLTDRIDKINEKLKLITSDPNTATRLYSPACFPSNSLEVIKHEPIDYEQGPYLIKSIDTIISSNSRENVPREINMPQESSNRDKEQLYENYKCCLKQNELILDSCVKLTSNKSCKSPLDSITYISSLLVYHTYESRLVKRKDKYLSSKKCKSLTSDSSIQDYRSHKSKVVYNVDRLANNNRSSSCEDLESNLGPVPGSILKYHQDSILDVTNFFENIDVLNEEDSNQLIGDLPDILPSLSGIVKNVNLLDERADVYTNENVRENQNTSAQIEEGSLLNTGNSHISQPPPPPPPPPPPNYLQLNQSKLNLPTGPVTQLAAAAAAPPPPPPPPPIPPPAPPAEMSGESLSKQAPNNQKEIIPPLTGRDALMAEIRAAGSKPKASTKLIPETKSSLKQNNQQSASKDDRMVNVDYKNGLIIETNSQNKQQFNSMNPRDSLLASIRDAAGKPKRKVVNTTIKSRKLEEKKIEQKKLSNSNDAPDLMSDLVNKLRARRDGISGSFISKKPAEAINEETLMRKSPRLEKQSAIPADTLQQRLISQVSSMIPARTPSSNSSDSEQDVADWN